ncbi:hypothetical protein Misp03_02370 [Microbispora sp. NBRC 16548]|nr:hypothetical protein Misp03_02370 [Microbispora sp. NBRC 16548]
MTKTSASAVVNFIGSLMMCTMRPGCSTVLISRKRGTIYLIIGRIKALRAVPTRGEQPQPSGASSERNFGADE